QKEPVILILKKYNLGNKPIIGVGGIQTLDQVLEALDLGFDMIAIGMAALADKSVVTHILNKQKIKKVIDDDSIIPKPLKERISQWNNLKDKGYSVR
ncbi:MAG: hypothetical protein ACOCUD_02200, partial [Bacillota bacterium]